MSTIGPYSPARLTTPAVNPAVASSQPAPIPYISCEQYLFAPTAMDTTNLVDGGDAAANTQSLYDTIVRASRWADRIVFGADPAAKGASLCATETVESGYFRVKTSQLRLVCSYKQILELTGCETGLWPGATTTIGSDVAGMAQFGIRTITIPYPAGVMVGRPGAVPIRTPSNVLADSLVYVVWSYVNGYPHTSLAASVAAGATALQVTAVDGNGGLWGVYPGDQLTLWDAANWETVTVSSVTPGTSTATVNLAQPTVNPHTLPTAPDFIPVTMLPADIHTAVIYLTTALIKTRGDFALALDEMKEPSEVQSTTGNMPEDLAIAYELLDPYRVRTKAKN